MTSFVATLYGVILMFAGVRGASTDDQARLQSVAQDVWTEVQTSKILPIGGEAGAEASALALVAFAGHESGFWSKVQDCSACTRGSMLCDKGTSISLYQLHEGSTNWSTFTRAQICESNSIATSLALRALNRGRGAGTPVGLFRVLGGRGGAAPEMADMFASATRRAGISIGTSETGSMIARWSKKTEKIALQP